MTEKNDRLEFRENIYWNTNEYLIDPHKKLVSEYNRFSVYLDK